MASLVRGQEEGSRYCGFGLLPKALAGGVDKECTEGVLARVKFTPASGAGASTLGPFLLPVGVPWLLSGSYSKHTGYKVTTNAFTEVQSWTEDFAVTRVSDASGVYGWVIAGSGVSATSVHPGLSKYSKKRARPYKGKDKKVVAAVETASGSSRPVCFVQCPWQLRRVERLVTRTAKETSAPYEPVAREQFSLRTGPEWSATLCPAGEGCGGQQWPCQVLFRLGGFRGLG